jgi:hypothetical protein
LSRQVYPVPMPMKSRIEDGCSLFQLGPVRLYRDRKAREIVIETTKDNAEGCGIEICRLPESRIREAQAIANLPGLIKAGGPFAALGIMVMGAKPEDPLIAAYPAVPGGPRCGMQA